MIYMYVFVFIYMELVGVVVGFGWRGMHGHMMMPADEAEYW